MINENIMVILPQIYADIIKNVLFISKVYFRQVLITYLQNICLTGWVRDCSC